MVSSLRPKSKSKTNGLQRALLSFIICIIFYVIFSYKNVINTTNITITDHQNKNGANSNNNPNERENKNKNDAKSNSNCVFLYETEKEKGISNKNSSTDDASPSAPALNSNSNSTPTRNTSLITTTNTNEECPRNVSHALFASNHKTGTVFLEHLNHNLANVLQPKQTGLTFCTRIISNHCQCSTLAEWFLFTKNSKNQNSNNSKSQKTTTLNKYVRKQHFLGQLNATLNLKPHSECFSIFQLVRNPIDTILSGYNYHKQNSKKTEQWLHRQLPAYFGKIKRDLEEYMLHMHMHAADKNSNSTGKGKGKCIIKLGNYTTSKNDKKKDYTLYKILHRENISIGLFITYGTYKYYSFHKIESCMHCNLTHLLPEYPKISVYHIPVESIFESSLKFNQTMNFIFNKADRNQNQNKERRREEFLDKMAHHDLNNKQHSRSKKERTHVTRGSYNSTFQTHVLLSLSTKVCLDIKHMTLQLQYKWKYATYC